MQRTHFFYLRHQYQLILTTFQDYLLLTKDLVILTSAKPGPTEEALKR